MRYIRQEQLSFIPKGFQNSIKDKRIVVVGCGGVGSPLCELLVRGGFLTLVLVDFDKIDETNLNRQVYFEYDIDLDKPIALTVYLQRINSKVNIEVYNMKLDRSNIGTICNKADLIIDATDSFETRRLINKYCEMTKRDWLYNGAVDTQFTSCIFKGKDKLFNKVIPLKIKEVRASDAGILPSTTFAAASLAYNQVLKYFLGLYDYKMIKINLWTNKIFEIKIKNK